MFPAELFRLQQPPRCVLQYQPGAKRVVPAPTELEVLRQEQNSAKEGSLSRQVQQGQHTLGSPGPQFSLTWKSLVSLSPSTEKVRKESSQAWRHQQLTSLMILLAFGLPCSPKSCFSAHQPQGPKTCSLTVAATQSWCRSWWSAQDEAEGYEMSP